MVATLPVHEGDVVASDQLLLTLWSEDLQAQLQLARQETLAATATAKDICLRSDVAEREAQRQLELRKKNLAAEESVDRAVTNAKASQAACGSAKAVIEVNRARIAVAEAALNRTMIHAPFAGRIAEINAEIGEFVTPSPPGIPTLPAIDLIDTSCIFIEAPIDEVDAPAVTSGMSARISLDAFAARPFEGRVKRTSPYVLEREKQARTVDVEVEFNQKSDSEALLPGYSADIEIILATHTNVLRIPSEAVMEGSRVYLYQASTGELVVKQITTGITNWKFTEVLSGLNAGDQVVVSIDREGVREGALVKPE